MTPDEIRAVLSRYSFDGLPRVCSMKVEVRFWNESAGANDMLFRDEDEFEITVRGLFPPLVREAVPAWMKKGSREVAISKIMLRSRIEEPLLRVMVRSLAEDVWMAEFREGLIFDRHREDGEAART